MVRPFDASPLAQASVSELQKVREELEVIVDSNSEKDSELLDLESVSPEIEVSSTEDVVGDETSVDVRLSGFETPSSQILMRQSSLIWTRQRCPIPIYLQHRQLLDRPRKNPVPRVLKTHSWLSAILMKPCRSWRNFFGPGIETWYFRGFCGGRGTRAKGCHSRRRARFRGNGCGIQGRHARIFWFLYLLMEQKRTRT